MFEFIDDCYMDSFTGLEFSRKRNSAHIENLLDFRNDFELLYDSFVNRFHWECDYFKDALTPYYIEKTIFHHTSIGLFKDEKYGFLLLPCHPIKKNTFSEPTEYLCTGVGYQKEVNKKDIAILRNNTIDSSPFKLIKRYAYKTSDLFRMHDVYAQGLKNPVIVFTDDKTSLSNKKIQDSRLNNENIIYVSYTLKDNFQPIAINTGHNSDDLRRLWLQRLSLLNHLLSQLGLKAEQLQKSAQMSQDELKENSSFTEINYLKALAARDKFVQECKEKFDFDISFKTLDELKDQYKHRLKYMMGDNNELFRDTNP